jgi:hypothetical protein
MKYVTAAVFALLSTPLAVAEAPSCDQIEALLSAAPSGFATTADLLGLTCAPQTSDAIYSLVCLSKKASSLTAAMEQRKTRDAIDACLTGWGKERRKGESDRIPDFEYGDAFTRQTADAEISVTAFVAREAKALYKFHGLSIVWKPRRG